MDDLDDFGQPICTHCHIVMRDTADGWACPNCGQAIAAEPADLPGSFDGPTIGHG